VELSRKQTEFWAVVLIVCLVTAVAVTLLDFSIKASILEESNALRIEIERWYRGRLGETTAQNGDDTNSRIDAPFPGDVLDIDASRLEKRSAPNGGKTVSGKVPSRKPEGNSD
jgi:hypothetical protein